MDLRSERAVRAIAEFLDLGLCWNDPFSFLVGLILSHTGGQQYREGDRKDNAEHFAHGRIFLYTLSLDLIASQNCIPFFDPHSGI